MPCSRPDPVIDEIREIRHQISAECGHDPSRLVAYFRQIQEQYADRLIAPEADDELRTSPEPEETIAIVTPDVGTPAH